MSTNSLYGGIFPSINFGALMSGQKIPKVDGMKEADRYPTPPNSEVVLLDSKDDTFSVSLVDLLLGRLRAHKLLLMLQDKS